MPGSIDVRKNLRNRCGWQHDKTPAASTHEFGGFFALQWRHESVDALAKVPNQTRLGKIDRAKFHFGFQIGAAVIGKSVTREKSG